MILIQKGTAYTVLLYILFSFISSILKPFITNLVRFEPIVVFTKKRSQAKVFTVYFSLKYLECNNYNVHSALDPLA